MNGAPPRLESPQGSASRAASPPVAHCAAPPPDLGMVRALLRRHAQLAEADLVFVGGSVADGLATPSSDVDVFIVRDVPRSPAALRLVPMPHDDLPFDLEIWSSAEVEDLLRRLSLLGGSADKDHRAFMRLGEEERDFLHSLCRAMPVHNHEAVERLKALLDPGHLARHSIQRGLMGISNSQTDLVGWLAIGDWQSSAFICQRLVEFAALVMVGAAGDTHPGGKWLLTLLRRNYDGVALPPRLLDGAADLASSYFALHRSPAAAEAGPDHSRGCTRFANLAVVYAQTERGGIADPLLRDIYWSAPTGAGPTGSIRPILSSAAQIRFVDGQWYLLRVAGDMFEINPAAAAMLLLMDGGSTVAEIVEALERPDGPGRAGLERSLQDLLLFLDNAGLLEM